MKNNTIDRSKSIEAIICNGKKIQRKVEIQSWALNNEIIEKKTDNLTNFEQLDDKYLTKSLTEKERIEKEEQKQKIVEVLRQIKNRKEKKRKMSKETEAFDCLMCNIMRANSEYKEKLKIEIKTKQKKADNILPHINKEPKSMYHKLETFKNINSGYARLIPGALKHNVTIERVLFKDLLKLSKDRYASKKEIDIDKRGFLFNQSKKGIFTEDYNTKYFLRYYLIKLQLIYLFFSIN